LVVSSEEIYPHIQSAFAEENSRNKFYMLESPKSSYLLLSNDVSEKCEQNKPKLHGYALLLFLPGSGFNIEFCF
jgi:hypothetical protein